MFGAQFPGPSAPDSAGLAGRPGFKVTSVLKASRCLYSHVESPSGSLLFVDVSDPASDDESSKPSQRPFTGGSASGVMRQRVSRKVFARRFLCI